MRGTPERDTAARWLLAALVAGAVLVYLVLNWEAASTPAREALEGLFS